VISFRESGNGLQEAQRAMWRALAAVKPDGALGRAVHGAIQEFFTYKEQITHVDTGTYRGAETVQFSGLRGVLFTSPSAVNPRSGGRRPVEYQEYEERRGGSHAAWARTDAEASDPIMRRAIQVFEEGLA